MPSLSDLKVDTKHLTEPFPVRLGKELGCAFTASFLVSPLVSILDKAMVKEIAGVDGFMREVKHASSEMFTHPKRFFGGLSFRLTFAVYAGTYAVANLSELLLDVYKVDKDAQRKPVKINLTTIANVSLLLWRDAIFAREFSGGTPKPRTPLRTLGCFAIRDGATMAATFYAAPLAADYLAKEHGVNEEVAQISTALAVPAVTQLFTAPIHIHALDYYARPVATMAERMGKMKDEIGKISFARTVRVLPAFGLGSYSNNKLRQNFVQEQNFPGLIRRRTTVGML